MRSRLKKLIACAFSQLGGPAINGTTESIGGKRDAHSTRAKLYAVVATVLFVLAGMFAPAANASGTEGAYDTRRKCDDSKLDIFEFNYGGVDWVSKKAKNKSTFVLWPELALRRDTIVYGGLVDKTNDCLSTYRKSSKSDYVSWTGILDQMKCHDLAPGGIGTGPTWDLEGHRYGASVATWIKTRCNW